VARTQIQSGVGLDIGSTHVRCVMCAIEDGYQRFVSHGEAGSVGWTRGRITDPAAVSACIVKAVETAERRGQMLVDGATVGLGGSTISSGASRGLYELGPPREIDGRDIHFAVRLSTEVQLEHDRFLLQAMPRNFTVDGRAGLRFPQRMVGSRLEAHTHIITTSTQEHEALLDAVHNAHLNVEETVFEGMAAAYACVVETERARGLAVVDIGSHSTELAIYCGDALVHSCSVPIGGDHFTRDVAAKFRIQFDDAELLKIEYGCARIGLSADNALIEIPSCDGRPSREALRFDLTDVLDARAEDLFKEIKKEIARAKLQEPLGEGVLLCGGGALLYGMEDMAEHVLDCNCRKGPPKDIDGVPDDLNRADWATAFGLALYSARLKSRPEFKRRAPGFLGLVLR
jgi:cell division protein FtsA